jgi:phosphoserine aminotransferase
MSLGKWHMKLFVKRLLWSLQREENYNHIKRIYSTLGTDYFQMQMAIPFGTQMKNSIIRYTISLTWVRIFFKGIGFSQFDIIYAGLSQKNIGPTGTTLVVIKAILR